MIVRAAAGRGGGSGLKLKERCTVSAYSLSHGSSSPNTHCGTRPNLKKKKKLSCNTVLFQISAWRVSRGFQQSQKREVDWNFELLRYSTLWTTKSHPRACLTYSSRKRWKTRNHKQGLQWLPQALLQARGGRGGGVYYAGSTVGKWPWATPVGWTQEQGSEGKRGWSKSWAQLRDQMVKCLGSLKVRRPGLILQADIKFCNLTCNVPTLAGSKDSVFHSHDPKAYKRRDTGPLWG